MFALFLALLSMFPGWSEEDELVLLWYNLENLFHPSDAPGSADDDFTPGGAAHWTMFRYREKLTQIARLVVAAGRGNPPDLLGFCEIEEESVLSDLSKHPLLRPYGYQVLHRQGPDHRGMEVACLYRPGASRLMALEWHAPPKQSGRVQTREVLQLSLLTRGLHRVDVFLLHLVSRYGGSGSTARFRKLQATQLLNCTDSVSMLNPGGLVVLLGDFNDVENSYSLFPLQEALNTREHFREPRLPGGRASYKYRGEWMQIDRALVLGCSDSYLASLSIPLEEQLLEEDPAFGGRRPRRTYEGLRYCGGTSDHLPLLLRLHFQEHGSGF
ncbi:MAG: hypothetical protein CSA96_01195 [Bacteroidetes bacterium]|nr:MAG: hypothetical protein CSA96_01195 [Bacteroidota bacterium]